VRNDQDGFTLIELMIVVSIVGILASLAIPAQQQFLLRSKRAELNMQLTAIRTAEEAYRAEWSYFTSCAPMPAQVPGRKAQPFPATSSTSYDWNMIGWVPDGLVFGQYSVSSNALQGQLATFTTDAYADIDGDNYLAHVRATNLLRPEMQTATNVY